MPLRNWYRNFGCEDTPPNRRGSKAEAIARANANFEKHFGSKMRKKRGK